MSAESQNTAIHCGTVGCTPRSPRAMSRTRALTLATKPPRCRPTCPSIHSTHATRTWGCRNTAAAAAEPTNTTDSRGSRTAAAEPASMIAPARAMAASAQNATAPAASSPHAATALVAPNRRYLL